MQWSRSPSAETGGRFQGDAGAEGREDAAIHRRFVEVARRAEIVGLVNASTSEGELGRRFTEELCEVFAAEIAFVLDDGGERRAPRTVAAVGIDGETVAGIAGRAEFADARARGRAISLTGDDVLGVGARSAVVAPFETEEGRVALVGVARIHEAPFDETECALLESLTLAAGQGLERIWAYESRNLAATEQSALLRAAKSMGGSLETKGVVETLCEEVRRGLDCDMVLVSLGDEVDGYVAVGTVGAPQSLIGFRQAPGSGLGGRAVQSGRTQVTNRYREEGMAPPETTAFDEVESCVAVPLRWDGRIRGFLSAGYTTTRRRITAAQVELIEGFGELAGFACANAERHAEVREAAETDGLTGCLNRDALQRRLRELLAVAENAGEPLSLALLDLDGFKAINDIFGHPSGDTVLKRVGAALRSTVRGGDLVGRYGGDEFALILPDSSEHRAAPVLDRVRSAIRSMEVPGGRLTACVGLAERVPGESLDDLLARADEALRDAKGALSPGSIRRARTSSREEDGSAGRLEMERGHRWRAVAGDIGLAMAREMDSGTSAAVATAELRDVLDLDRASVLQLVPGGMLEVIAEAGPKAPSVQFREAEKGTVGKALREKRPILGRQGSIRRDSDRRSPQHSAAEVAVPLIFGGKAWGAISCTAGDRPLDEVDAELVAAVAEHLSASIRTGDLYEQLTQSMIGTAEALAAAMAAKDSYTADHAKSIAKIAVAVARELSLPESAVEDVRYAGVFHDLGKIAMPDSLINKPGPLTPDEFEVIKEHPVIGSEILAPVPYLYGVRSIVRHAHEHWDGSGYPEGLRGGQIPLGARIILAVDAFHAMTSDRPYRRRLSRQDAYAELRRCAGIQFDPEVIEALMSVLMRQDAAADA